MYIYHYSSITCYCCLGAIGGGEFYGDNERNAILKNVSCNGTESSLLECSYGFSGQEAASECGALTDAHVVCQCELYTLLILYC